MFQLTLNRCWLILIAGILAENVCFYFMKKADGFSWDSKYDLSLSFLFWNISLALCTVAFVMIQLSVGP
eukprot:UN16033